MMNSKIQQTVFSIERLKNVVNIGSSSAYQIYTSPGEQIGTIGTVVNPATLIPVNDENFLPETTGVTTEGAPTSWFRRTLAALKS